MKGKSSKIPAWVRRSHGGDPGEARGRGREDRESMGVGSFATCAPRALVLGFWRAHTAVAGYLLYVKLRGVRACERASERTSNLLYVKLRGMRACERASERTSNSHFS